MDEREYTRTKKFWQGAASRLDSSLFYGACRFKIYVEIYITLVGFEVDFLKRLLGNLRAFFFVYAGNLYFSGNFNVANACRLARCVV